MIGLTGPRGVGKTTLILQYIKENLNPNTALYVTAEDFYFADHKLLDLADSYTKVGGKHLFIDEIHKYKNWSKELKLIYDYHPELKIIFTGSSILDINKGVSDLSRRAIMYQMQGLSFREYLQLFHQISTDIYDLQDIITHKVEIPEQYLPAPFSGLPETRLLPICPRRHIRSAFTTDHQPNAGIRHSPVRGYECIHGPKTKTIISDHSEKRPI